eukprot:176809-Rhodomonas_salina.1
MCPRQAEPSTDLSHTTPPPPAATHSSVLTEATLLPLLDVQHRAVLFCFPQRTVLTCIPIWYQELLDAMEKAPELHAQVRPAWGGLGPESWPPKAREGWSSKGGWKEGW